ncbi:MAG: sarcosine oxidase subunit beta family protein [Alphaproteobacteria bacterium]|nr:sarcosine oxidase subunit beta family protein [Alphaproteobacteria bacterium]
MLQRFSVLGLAKHALTGHRRWRRHWRAAEPGRAYDVVIVGGGGHGLATAFYLAKNHGIRNVAVLEKGWIGGGNTGRNTMTVRSNYLVDDNARFYEFSLQLWEGLAHALNFNIMLGQRGVLNLCHNDHQMDAAAERGNAMRLKGIDSELLDLDDLRRELPLLDLRPDQRYPVMGGLIQRRAGIVRHDAVAWGFARAASDLGVDIVEDCAVTAITRQGGRVTEAQTSRGTIACGALAFAVAGNSGQLAAMAGFRLPIESHVLQAFVTEPVTPVLEPVVTYGGAHLYICQSDKGGLVLGGDLDGYNSYAQRGNLPLVEHCLTAAMQVFPSLGRLRILRCWGGIADMTMDGSPVMGRTPLDNLWITGGWCYGGFKATPASGFTLAHSIAHGEPHELIRAYALDRFLRGRALDESGTGPFPNRH